MSSARTQDTQKNQLHVYIHNISICRSPNLKCSAIYKSSKENEVLRYTLNKTCTGLVLLKLQNAGRGNQRRLE